MADIRTTTDTIDLANPPGPEFPMRQGGRWGPLDTSVWAENRLNVNPDFGSYGPGDLGNGLFWSVLQAGPFFGDCEVWGKVIGGQLGVAGEGWRLGLIDVTSFGAGTIRGYKGLVFHALGDFVGIRRHDSSTSAVNLSATGGAGGPPPWDHTMLFRRVNTGPSQSLEIWETTTADYSTWSMKFSASDATYQGPMMLAWGSEDPTHGGLGWTDVGGGNAKKTRIIRWPSH